MYFAPMHLPYTRPCFPKRERDRQYPAGSSDAMVEGSKGERDEETHSLCALRSCLRKRGKRFVCLSRRLGHACCSFADALSLQQLGLHSSAGRVAAAACVEALKWQADGRRAKCPALQWFLPCPQSRFLQALNLNSVDPPVRPGIGQGRPGIRRSLRSLSLARRACGQLARRIQLAA